MTKGVYENCANRKSVPCYFYVNLVSHSKISSGRNLATLVKLMNFVGFKTNLQLDQICQPHMGDLSNMVHENPENAGFKVELM